MSVWIKDISGQDKKIYINKEWGLQLKKIHLLFQD
jgi:hypothetical protein